MASYSDSWSDSAYRHSSHHKKNINWQEGEIAFLRPHTAFSSEDYNNLIESRYLHMGATGHPVVILRRISPNSSHVLVTPISAYSSGDYNDNLAPWRQPLHSNKKYYDFRSFEGSELPPYCRQEPLRLRDGDLMPKHKCSWVYIHSVWAVPLSVIGRFNKTRHILRLTDSSLASLQKDIAGKCCDFFQRMLELQNHEPARNQPRQPASHTPAWRTASSSMVSSMSSPVPSLSSSVSTTSSASSDASKMTASTAMTTATTSTNKSTTTSSSNNNSLAGKTYAASLRSAQDPDVAASKPVRGTAASQKSSAAPAPAANTKASVPPIAAAAAAPKPLWSQIAAKK